MSAGPFVIRFYEADSGDIHLIKSQPESAIFSIGGSPNTLPAGPATSNFWAETSKGNKEYGLRPRKVRIRWTGTPPTGYQENAVLSVPVYQSSVYNGATILSTGTYLGAPCQVVGKLPEQIYPGI